MFKYFEPNKIFSITSKAPKYVLFLFIVILSIGLTGVFSNIKDNAILRGTPAMDERSFNRSYVYFKNLEKIAKDLNDLKKLDANNN